MKVGVEDAVYDAVVGRYDSDESCDSKDHQGLESKNDGGGGRK